jgi:ABC-type proline/glycine betaine transport system permease subunit
MPVREAKPEYSKMTIRELKAMARGTGIKSWEKLRKAELLAALSAI